MVDVWPVSVRDLRRGLELSVLADSRADRDGDWFAAADGSFLQGRHKRLLASLS